MSTVPSAEILADSIGPTGSRIITMKVVFHRFVLAEFNTHRVLSRNSASSRAIPVHKMIDKVMKDPAIPLSFPAEQKGMQGGAELSLPDAYDSSVIWQQASQDAVMHAKELVELGVHKSVVNRLLEPFLWHTAVVTATAWENFFDQRCSPLAQPEIRAVSEAMYNARENSTPVQKELGDWHLPFISDEERNRGTLEDVAKISAARCARVSYLTHDGKRDMSEDMNLYNRLVDAQPPHWSPLEHPARVANNSRFTASGNLPMKGNLYDWLSLRTQLENSVGSTYR